MDRIRTLIVDDEPPARAKVARILRGRTDVEVVGEAGDGAEAVERIRSLSPDLVILDIQMPGKTGFDVLQELEPDQLPHVVFATAYDQHAIQAFDVAAADYLLKPFNKERLYRAVDRVKERLAQRANGAQEMAELLELLRPRAEGSYLDRIAVESRGRRLIVKASEIRTLRADGNYVSIHVAGKSYLHRGTLGSYEERLDPGRFVRVHRSVLVNVQRITELRPIARGDQMLVLDDGSEVRMSRHYREGLAKLLDL